MNGSLAMLAIQIARAEADLKLPANPTVGGRAETTTKTRRANGRSARAASRARSLLAPAPGGGGD